MRKILSLFVVALVAITLLGCATANGAGAPALQLTGADDALVTMDTIDNYLFADNVRFIDMRDPVDAMSDGYIAGFELLPFKAYLENRALVRNTGWNFTPADLVDAELLESFFGDKDATLVFMCLSGTRCGYVMQALEYLGYTNMINAGGIRDYNGRFLVGGTQPWNGAMGLPPAGVTMDNIDEHLNRPGAKYVDFRNAIQYYTDGYIDGFMTKSFFEFIEGQEIVVRSNGWNFSASDVKDDFMLEELFGDQDREIFLMCLSGARSGYMKQALESIGYTNVHNVGGIQDYTGVNRVAGDPSFSF